MNKFFLTILLSVFSVVAMAQLPRSFTAPRPIPVDSLNYLNPKDYIIGGVTVTGSKNLDKDVLLTISKLNKGDKINLPGEANAKVIKDMYAQNIFDDVQLYITKLNGDTVYLEIAVKELPRLSRMHITGIRKGEIEDIQKQLNDRTGKIVNQNLLTTTTNTIKKYLGDKGFLNTTVAIKEREDPGDANSLILDVAVDKHKKVMINSVTFEGNKDFSAK